MDAKWEWHIQGKCLSVAWQTGRQQELEREREEGEKTINKGKWANKKKRKMANSIREWERRAKKEKIICACTLEIKMTKQGLQLPIHAYTPQNIPVTFSVKQVDRRGSHSTSLFMAAHEVIIIWKWRWIHHTGRLYSVDSDSCVT